MTHFQRGGRRLSRRRLSRHLAVDNRRRATIIQANKGVTELISEGNRNIGVARDAITPLMSWAWRISRDLLNSRRQVSPNDASPAYRGGMLSTSLKAIWRVNHAYCSLSSLLLFFFFLCSQRARGREW